MFYSDVGGNFTMKIEIKKIIAKEVIILTISGTLILLCFGATRLWNNRVNEQIAKLDTIKVSVDSIESFRSTFINLLTPSDRKLWGALTSENLFTGDYSEFKNKFSTEGSILVFFNQLNGNYYSKTFKDFKIQFFTPNNRTNIFRLLTDSAYLSNEVFFKHLAQNKDTVYQLIESEGTSNLLNIHSKKDFSQLVDLAIEHITKKITKEDIIEETNRLTESKILDSTLIKIFIIGLIIIYPIRILWYLIKWSLEILKQSTRCSCASLRI